MQNTKQELEHLLADTANLMLKTLNFHWNVKGTSFFSLHEIFQKQYEDLFSALDEVAEQISMLGSYVPGSLADFTKLSTLKGVEKQLDSKEMVKELIKDHETMISFLNKLILEEQEEMSPGIADILTTRLQTHTKFCWMLKSYLN